MADVLWTGGVQAQRQIDTLTVTTAAVGAVYIATVNGKAASYTGVTGDTTATIATAWAAAFAGVQDGEIAELAAAAGATAGTVLVTGPTDGAPFTMTVTATGGGAASRATTTAAKSPADVGDAGNYSTGALPIAGDRLVVENFAGSLSYNLAALTALAVSLVRRASHTGVVGLSDVSARGYREYRPTHLEVRGLAHAVETTRGDGVGAVRIRGVSTTGGALTVVGDGAASLGAEPVELYDGTAWTVSVSNSGVGLARTAPKAVGVTTLRVLDSAVTVGAGATVGAATLTNAAAAVAGAVTTLALDRDGTATVVRAGSVATALTVDAGTVSWQSTANPPAAAVGSGGTLTFEAAPAGVTPGLITLNEGATLLDPAGRLAKPYDVRLSRTEVTRVSLDFGTDFKLTVGT